MKSRRFSSDQRGATAVEFALLAPAFLLTLGGVIDVGLMTWTQLGIEHAVQSGARCASLGNTTCSSATSIATYASTQAYGLGLPASTFAYSKTTCGYQVTANYTYYFLSNSFPKASTALSALACAPA